MRRSDFHYSLPEALIAQYPLAERRASRLLQLDGPSGQLDDGTFADVLKLIGDDDLVVFNDTRVIPARLHGHKETGGRVEILIERVTGERSCLAHVRASKSPKPGTRLLLDGDGDHVMLMRGRAGDLFDLELVGDIGLMDVLDQVGHMPLPPYIERDDETLDQSRYQTVFAERPGAVAAPTAGLHFDEAMLTELAERGVAMARVTLHVGAGTFQPVRADDLQDHVMHHEWIEVKQDVVDAVAACRQRGGRVISVGTTVCRSLESAARDGELKAFCGDTDLFLYPGKRFHVIDALITNFHLPESTLLMLVSAFAGYEAVMAAYAHAVEQRYRFFSYGDAMWLTRTEPGQQG